MPRNDKLQKFTRVHIRCSIDGEPARILTELKDRGLVRSHADAVSQGLLVLWEKIIARELQEAQLRASRRLGEE